MDGQAFAVFIDYSKVYDSISQIQMFEIIAETGFPKHLVAFWKRFITMTSQLSLDGTVATVVHPILREE